jgi:Glycosyltransferase family 87
MKDRPPRLPLKNWPWIECACLAFLVFLVVSKGVVPGWRALHSDFPNYYVVARLMREGYNLDRIYDWVWLQRVKDHWGITEPLVSFAGLTPLSALPVFPIAGFAALTAKRLWILANLVFLFGTAETLHRVTKLGRRRVWIFTLLAIIPLRSNFVLGQMHVVVLFLLALAYFFRSRSRPAICGISIAFAGALKIYPLLFVAYFAWKRQWREVVSIVFATAALICIGYAWMGGHLMHIYLSQVLPRSMQGEVIDPYNARAASVAAFLHRLFIYEPGLNPAPVWNQPLLYSILYPLWQVAVLFPLFLSIRPSSDDGDTERLEWAIFLIALLVLSPVPSSYHFVVLILPMVLVADVLLKRNRYGWLSIVVLLYSIMCIAVISPANASSGFSFLTVLAFSRLWIGLALWLILVAYLWQENTFNESRRSITLRAFPLGAALCVFWIAGFNGYQRHFAHLDKDIGARLRLRVHPLLATDIHPKAGDFVATAMMQNYRIVDQDGRDLLPFSQAGTDQLSSAVTANALRVFIEFADSSGSHIALRDSPAFKLQDAEHPALSADGSVLAYIREEKGRGRLRLAHLEPSPEGIAAADDAEVVGAPYDVRDAAFTPAGEIVFAARVSKATNIYQVTPGGKPSALIVGGEEADAPDVSPGGQRLVFRRLIHDRWQLLMMDLSSRRERQLTFGDCNAFAPTWMNESTIAYGSDCGRGLGLSALASVSVGQ